MLAAAVAQRAQRLALHRHHACTDQALPEGPQQQVYMWQRQQQQQQESKEAALPDTSETKTADAGMTCITSF